MEYSAKEIAELLNKDGFMDVTSRTVNYYAFDKKMFEITSSGKKCFSEIELKKIKGIKKLQEATNFTLEQIKEVINKYSYEEIEARFSPVSYRNVGEFESTYSSIDTDTPNLINSNRSTNFSSLIGHQPQIKTKSFTEAVSNSVNIEQQNTLQRNLRINEDITLTISDNINTEKLQEIVKNIQEILKENK